MSIVDLFQQWLYDHPDHTISQRKTYRNKLNEEFPCSLRKGAMELWQGEYMMYMDNFWQRQSHIVAHPFYYIEYGIAYLAAVQLYQQWQKDPQQAIVSYRTILES